MSAVIQTVATDDGQDGWLRWTRIDWDFIARCGSAFLGLPNRPASGVIAVVSPRRQDGRSTIAAGLAAGIAQVTDEATLLLDLDFYRPSQAERFGIPRTARATDYLRTGATPPQRAGFSGGELWALPAPIVSGSLVAGLFQTLRSNAWITPYRRAFAWVVIDAPPLLDCPDGRLVSALADAYLLVGHHRRTTFGELRATTEGLSPGRPTGFFMSQPRARPMPSSGNKTLGFPFLG